LSLTADRCVNVCRQNKESFLVVFQDTLRVLLPVYLPIVYYVRIFVIDHFVSAINFLNSSFPEVVFAYKVHGTLQEFFVASMQPRSKTCWWKATFFCRAVLSHQLQKRFSTRMPSKKWKSHLYLLTLQGKFCSVFCLYLKNMYCCTRPKGKALFKFTARPEQAYGINNILLTQRPPFALYVKLVIVMLGYWQNAKTI